MLELIEIVQGVRDLEAGKILKANGGKGFTYRIKDGQMEHFSTSSWHPASGSLFSPPYVEVEDPEKEIIQRKVDELLGKIDGHLKTIKELGYEVALVQEGFDPDGPLGEGIFILG